MREMRNIRNKGGVFIGDFKLSPDGKVHFVEFGCGVNSTFDGYDRLPQHPLTMRQKTRALLSRSAQLYCDVVLLGHGAHRAFVNDYRAERSRKSSIECRLETDRIGKHPIFRDPSLVVSIAASKEAAEHAIQLTQSYERQSERRSPIFLMGHNTFLGVTKDKAVLSKLITKTRSDLSPKTRLIDLRNFDINEIDNLNFNRIVIKPANASGGNGVLVCDSQLRAKNILNLLKRRVEPDDYKLVLGVGKPHDKNINYHERCIYIWVTKSNDHLGGRRDYLDWHFFITLL